MTQDESRPPSPELKRVLGLWDIVFFTVVAVTGLRWISRGARVGAPSVLLWGLAWLAFFVPLALAVSVLAKKHPEAELVPVHLENLNRILPKGTLVLVPLLAAVTFGKPVRIEEGEDKPTFLARAKCAVEELDPPEGE